MVMVQIRIWDLPQCSLVHRHKRIRSSNKSNLNARRVKMWWRGIQSRIFCPSVLWDREVWLFEVKKHNMPRAKILQQYCENVQPRTGWQEVRGDWRKLHNVEFADLQPLINIRAFKERKMRWAKHVARMGRKRMHIRFGMKPDRNSQFRLMEG